MANIYPLNYASSEHHTCRQKVFHGLNVTVVWTIKAAPKKVSSRAGAGLKKRDNKGKTKFQRAAGGALIKWGYKNRKLHIKVVTWIRAKASSPGHTFETGTCTRNHRQTETKWVKRNTKSRASREAACFFIQNACIFSLSFVITPALIENSYFMLNYGNVPPNSIHTHTPAHNSVLICAFQA